MNTFAWLRRRWLRLTIIIVLLIPLLLAGTAWTLLGTRAGNLWVINQISKQLPGRLQVHGWQGNLLGGLQVAAIDYRHDGERLSISKLTLQLEASALLLGRLHLQRLSADSVVRIGAATPAAPATATRPSSLPDNLALPLMVRIDALAVGQILVRGENTVQINQVVGQDLSAGKHFRIGRLALDADGVQVDTTLTGTLTAPYQLAGTLDWQRPAEGEQAFQGHLEVAGNLRKLHVTHTLDQPMTVVSSGTVGYQHGTVELELTHQWPAQTLPVTTSVPIKLGAGRIVMAGTPESLSVQGQTDLRADDQPLQLRLDARTDGKTLNLKTLEATAGDQILALQGTLRYGQGLSWQLSATGQHLDPAVLAPQWPGQLALQLSTAGHWQDADHWQLTLDPLTLQGRLKKQPLALTGTAQPAQNGATAIHLRGKWGGDHIETRGTVGQRLNLDGTLSIADLERWLAPADGHASLTWQIRGSPAAPVVSGRLRADQLGWQDWQLERLQVRFRQLSLGSTDMTLHLQGDGLQQGQTVRADRLVLDASGTRRQHTVTLRVERGEADTRLTLDGTLDQQDRWRARLTEWHLRQPELGTWRLQKPAELQLSSRRQELGTLCLVADQGGGKLCLTGHHDGSKLAAQVHLQQLPLALANPWLGDHIRLAGRIDADAQLGGTRQAPSAQWKVAVHQGQVALTRVDARQTLSLSEAKLTGELADGQLHSRVDLVVADQGEVHARMESGLTADSPLRGELALSIPDLAGLAPLIPQISSVQGNLTGRLQLTGTLAQPGARGKLVLGDGQATIPQLGIAVTAVDLALTGTPDGVDLHGQAYFGEQALQLRGYWRPARSPLALTLHLKGQRLLVANRKDVKVHISPDLTLRGRPTGIDLSGTVAVPEADLQPRQLPASAITVSSDQILVGAQAEPESALPLSMAITVTLGQDVHFEGFGLKADLGGQLKVTQKPGEPAQLYGDLVIREGRYKAYGQNLAIDDGRLLFQGAPDNPGLDLRAIRKIPSDSQIVGLRLGGTLKKPQATIFSDPELEQSQAMSYLLTGHPLSQGGDSDSARIAQALALYGLQQGQGVTRKIGDTLGLDEISIGSDWGDAGDAALMLGKQLSSRLYLSYAVGLFDAVSTVMLRYTLTRSLHLEAKSSSKSQSIDLIWERELR